MRLIIRGSVHFGISQSVGMVDAEVAAVVKNIRLLDLTEASWRTVYGVTVTKVCEGSQNS